MTGVVETSGPGAVSPAPGLPNAYEGGAEMPDRTCTIDGCEKPHYGRGWCNTHWARWRRSGDPQKKTLTRHHLRHTPAYASWHSMRQRCLNPNATGYPNYGGRGITVCDRWADFLVFLDDMGERPEGTTLDRIDNDGDYEPGNCRWATWSEQERNRRPSRDWKGVSQRRVATREALIRHPEMTNREISALVGVTGRTVAAVRRELENEGQIPAYGKTRRTES